METKSVCRAYKDGYKEWVLNNQIHREDGPARMWLNGEKEWWLHGKLHRMGGPACEYTNHKNRWYMFGRRFSKKEFDLWTKEINQHGK